MLGGLKSLFKGRKPSISREESLKGVPVVPGYVESEEGPNGERLVLAPRRPPFGETVQKWIGTEPEPLRIMLDTLGNSVWRKIDGKRNVAEIVALFAKERDIHKRDAEASVVKFLNMLMERGLVSVMVPKKNGKTQT